ncbi:MAG TPA: sugar phosphate nucleotidyltransferase [Thermoanaerobaculia bacterium]|nr:sugar phosphate nucleotidyltransferase [Thermoanaerobaculia bacterium]
MIALVLAAGLGTRFRPATLATPKPLLPLLGRPILFRLLDHLIAEGATRFVVNAHHLADEMRSVLAGGYRGLPIDVSYEREILGTAGAIRRAHKAGLLPDPRFLVANGDLFTTLGLGRLLRARSEPGVASALGVVPRPEGSAETPLFSDDRGRLVALGAPPASAASGPWLFTGIQAATAALLPLIPEGKSELARDVLAPSLARGERAFALVPYVPPADGLWFDLGTPERLAAAEDEIRRRGLA